MLQPQINSARIAPMEMMQRVGVILLSNGGFTVVDPERVGELNVRRWCNSEGYVRSGIRRGKKTETLQMHRVVMGAKKGQEVDHRNMDPLDNRAQNLRVATKSQNAANTKKMVRASTCPQSKFKGVAWDKGAWRAKVAHQYLGRFQSEIDAAKAYNAAALAHFGEYARLNEIP